MTMTIWRIGKNTYRIQVDGTTYIHTLTDHSADDEDTEPDNNTCKRERKVHVPADANRKELTKQRQAQVLKIQQEKERLKAQALEDRDNIDKASRTKSKRPIAQPEDNGENIDTNSPRPQRSKGKASHPDQSRVQKRIEKCLEQVGMLQCLMVLPQTQTLQMKNL